VQLIADENVHGKVVARLRAAGYDLAWIKEIAKSAGDPEILRRADVAAAIFITNDRDYGELVFLRGLPPPRAILYTRTPHRDWKLTSDLLITELERGVELGKLTTISAGGVRHKPYPIGASNA